MRTEVELPQRCGEEEELSKQTVLVAADSCTAAIQVLPSREATKLISAKKLS